MWSYFRIIVRNGRYYLQCREPKIRVPAKLWSVGSLDEEKSCGQKGQTNAKLKVEKGSLQQGIIQPPATSWWFFCSSRTFGFPSPSKAA